MSSSKLAQFLKDKMLLEDKILLNDKYLLLYKYDLDLILWPRATEFGQNQSRNFSYWINFLEFGKNWKWQNWQWWSRPGARRRRREAPVNFSIWVFQLCDCHSIYAKFDNFQNLMITNKLHLNKSMELVTPASELSTVFRI